MKQILRWRWLGLFIAFSLVSFLPTSLTAAQKAQAKASTIQLGGDEPWLGVMLEDVTQAKAQELKLPGVYGAIVASVEPNSPAAKAGLEKNDVILQFAGDRVWSVAQLSRLVHETPAGRTVNLKVSRGGKTISLQATIENHPGIFFNMPPLPSFRNFKVVPLPNPPAPGTPSAPRFWSGPLPPSTPFNNPLRAPQRVLGITGYDLTPQLARYFGVAQGEGVLVTSVAADSPAGKAGLETGDVIIRVRAQKIGSVAELQQALQTGERKPHRVFLTIVRNHQEQTVSVVLPPLGSRELQTAEDWNAWNLSSEERARLNAEFKKLAAQVQALKAEPQLGSQKYREILKQVRQAAREYAARAAEYQKRLEQMQSQLRRQLEPMKQNLKRELEQERQQLEMQKNLLRRLGEQPNEV